MRRLYYPVSGGDHEQGDDLVPQVRGWPSNPAVTYDASAPGTKFDTWNANINVRVTSSPMVAATCPFAFNALADGSEHISTLWVPPPGTPFVFFGLLLNLTSIIISGGGAPSANLTVGVCTGLAASRSTTLTSVTVPMADAGWAVLLSNYTWQGAGNGAQSPWGFLGSYHSGSESFDNNFFDNGAISTITPGGVFTMPLHAQGSVGGGPTADRFVLSTFTNSVSGSPSVRYSGTAYFLVMPLGL